MEVVDNRTARAYGIPVVNNAVLGARLHVDLRRVEPGAKNAAARYKAGLQILDFAY